MKEKLASTVPIFRSDGQAAMLQALRFAADGLSLTDLAERCDLAVSHVHTEVERLERSGVVRSRRVGRTRLVSLDPESPVAHEIASLVDKLLGVEALVGAALAGLPRIESAMIFGSWAARRVGIAGPDPGDVDVLVIGEPDADDAYDALRDVEEVIGRPISMVVRTAEEWTHDDSPLARSIREGPSIGLNLDGRA